MAILARGQITVTIAEKGEDGRDYNNYIGEWYIGTRGAGHSFEFSPAPADTTSAELKIYQKDLESEIRITLNGHTVVEEVGGVNGVLDWKTYKLNISHVHFTEYNVIRIEHNGSATADWVELPIPDADKVKQQIINFALWEENIMTRHLKRMPLS